MLIKYNLSYTIVIIERGSLKLVITPGEDDELGEALATVIDTLDSNADWKALYKQVFGRWRKIALTTAESKSFWIVNKLMLPSLAIVDRFRHFLQSQAKLKRETGVGALAHLVWHKADFYLTKIDELVESQEANDLIHEVRALVFSRVFSDACRYGFSCRISTTDVSSMRVT